VDAAQGRRTGDADEPAGALALGSILLQQRWSVAPEHLADFEKWYDDEHLRDVVAVPGVLVGRRFVRDAAFTVATPTVFDHVTLYEIASLEAFETPEYQALRNPKSPPPKVLANSRTLYRALYPEQGALVGPTTSTDTTQPNGASLLHIMMSTEPGCEEEFNAWYNEEHLPMISSRPGVLHGRRFVAIDGAPPADDVTKPAFRYLALYELEGDAVPPPGPEEEGYPTPRRQALGSRLAAQIQHLVPVNYVTATAGPAARDGPTGRAPGG
jgi:hypothetical protein